MKLWKSARYCLSTVWIPLASLGRFLFLQPERVLLPVWVDLLQVCWNFDRPFRRCCSERCSRPYTNHLLSGEKRISMSFASGWFLRIWGSRLVAVRKLFELLPVRYDNFHKRIRKWASSGSSITVVSDAVLNKSCETIKQSLHSRSIYSLSQRPLSAQLAIICLISNN